MRILGRTRLCSRLPQPWAVGGSVLYWMGLPRLLCLLALLVPTACFASQIASSRVQQEEEHEATQHVLAAQAVAECRRQSVPRAALSIARAQHALRAPKFSRVPPLTVTGHRLCCGHSAPLRC